MSMLLFPPSNAPLRKVKAIQFGILNPVEITKFSVAEISCDNSQSKTSTTHTLLDKRLGPSGPKRERCHTCQNSVTDCAGHFGHIKLADPLFHYGFLDTIHYILRCVCWNCHQLLVSTKNFRYITAMTCKDPVDRLRKIQETCQKGRCSISSKEYENWVLDPIAEDSRPKEEPTGCESTLPTIKRVNSSREDGASCKLFFVAEFDNKDDSIAEKKQDLSSQVIYERLKNISDDVCRDLGLDPKNARPDWMMITVLPVPPLAVRPSVMSGASSRGNEDDLTLALIEIVKKNNELIQKKKDQTAKSAYDQLLALLQYFVASYIANNLPGLPTATNKSGRALKSISDRLKGKEGRIRGNLMGKRVDFSARTVITPDPNISIDQVGVPRSIARNLTFPEIVTPYNFERMRQLVENGPDIHPGAKYIIRTDNQRIDLRVTASDRGLQCGYRVERHVQDGDIIVFNRQPSLHKMSMMGHRIKIMPYSTFRLNLSVTSPYNADFDGDEMNMHVPQTLNAKAEVMQIMMVPKQIISPQGNKPVIGIVQDTLLGSYLITRRDVFIEKDVVMNMLMWVNFDGKVPEPAIIKPQQLWTGKQLFSIIIPKEVNLRMYNSSFSKEKDGEPVDDFLHPQDLYIFISQGSVLSGTFDKKVLGSVSGGLIHTIWMEHGPEQTQLFIDQCQGLVNYWLLQRGFTIGIGDTIADEATQVQIRKTIDGAKAAVEGLNVDIKQDKLERQPGLTVMQSFEQKVNSYLNKARDDAGSSAQKSLKFANNIKTMVTGGSKGSNINISQMMACVGQQNVEGKRIGYGFLDRTLPHFTKDDYGPISRGFVENSYLIGLTPAEFFFHAMGGREGLIDTAVKTAETGYIQRRLVKAMEDVMVKYDGTVRNSLGDIIQFIYGEDGMDATFIEKQRFETLEMHDHKLKSRFYFDVDSDKFREYVPSSAYDEIIDRTEDRRMLEEEYRTILKDRDLLRHQILPEMKDDWPVPVNLHRLIQNVKNLQRIDTQMDTRRDLDPRYVIKKVKELYSRDLLLVAGDDPISREAQRNATLLLGILLRTNLASKVIIHDHKMNKKSFDLLLNDIRSRFQQAKVHAGEMVGAIAAQSIGEPATQMTLNTFHYAGVSSKSNTMGVPRLREIINVSKNIATPSMVVWLRGEYEMDNNRATSVREKLEYATLQSLCESTEIWFDPEIDDTVIEQDRSFLEGFYLDDVPKNGSNFILRLVLRQSRTIQLMTSQANNAGGNRTKNIAKDISDKIKASCNTGSDRGLGYIECEYTPVNDPVQVIRIRHFSEDIGSDNISDLEYLRACETRLMELSLEGVPKIKKVFMENNREKDIFDERDGSISKQKVWTFQTEGSNLQAVLPFDEVDEVRTISNDVVEILDVLGIEAARNSVLLEIKKVISFDGSYVNYRHLATLSDVMTYRGGLMAITRHGINRTETGALMRCSFEETVDILLNAAAFAETDNLAGVSENIMLGQLAPVGTGSFDLILDEEMLKTNTFEVVTNDLHQYDDNMYRTPAMGTPGFYNSSTPAYMGSESPSMADFHSPSYQHSPDFLHSPYNSSPEFSSSPTYSGGASPTYSPTSPSYSPTSPSYSPTSPSYSPTSPSYSPTSPSYSPTSPSYSPTSPSYSPTSPSYSPTSPSYSPTSPSYSPTSPSYSPTSPSYSPTSPSYSPTSPSYSPTSPSYSPTSPSYSPTSPSYSPTSPSYSPTSPSYSPTSPSYSPSSPSYSPSSPSYSPTSPSYSPTSPSYSPSSPSYSPTSPSYSPVSPSLSPTSPNFYGAGYSPASPSYSPTNDDDDRDKKRK